MNFEEYINSEDAIFHYTTKKVFFESILQNFTLRLSPLEMMNDPIEYGIPISAYSMIGSPKKNTKLINEAYDYLNNLKLRKTKIACFCSNIENQTKGYLRSRMWSQYGENHEGLCLVFSKSAISNLIDNNFKFEAVNYIDEPFPLLDYIINYNELIQKSLKHYFDDFFEKTYKNIFFKKIIDYRDESEYRLLKRVESKDLVFDYFNIKKCLKGIIIGDKFQTVYHIILKKIEKDYKLDIRQSRFDKTSGLLTLTKISNTD